MSCKTNGNLCVPAPSACRASRETYAARLGTCSTPRTHVRTCVVTTRSMDTGSICRQIQGCTLGRFRLDRDTWTLGPQPINGLPHKTARTWHAREKSLPPREGFLSFSANLLFQNDACPQPLAFPSQTGATVSCYLHQMSSSQSH